MFFVAFAFVLGIFFLYVPAIEQDDAGDLFGGVSAIYLAAETFLDELGEATAVVNVGVCYQDGVDLAGWDGEGIEVSVAKVPLLIQAAID